MPRFRKRPVEIEAMQISVRHDDDIETDNDLSIASIAGWLLGHGFRAFQVVGERPFGLIITTLEGAMRADAGDWIIRGVNGEFYPCKPDIFEKTYEPVTEAADA